ncbi:SidA/IucD/PvdA family monooxygenase [Erwiniaceae bacterium BAC15a-03b]|uniref:SidA/IucD/PvdA family monooxygenase n=1 Tax=Winslowiella arboricola TaxID=2978220 RepID=A0A9J6PS40_9GAMM|nr:SidA/IucD/PvdA family monooxygenase [Winslowiella arboricola]MCU5775321.1 SidA/IucD/PvdA family monooxygenase [Winslowiella arboricola]MCU5780282.1 SidA/IucD/PvdA family monooxygenase [Winslowiella arboricola]
MTQPYDFIGIGIGPFNLSIAALSQQIPDFSCLFLEQKPKFSWHPGMMVPDCQMQTSFLKDLVSAIAPTSPYSFISYLVDRKKFYRFLTTGQRTVSREEFADYLHWAAERLDCLMFSQQVKHITFDHHQRLFTIITQSRRYQARHVCLGIGKQARLPTCVKERSDSCFHASEMVFRNPDLRGKRVVVVGGGQSGADLFLNILRAEWGQPRQLNWISRRNNYHALDEAAFANEYFTPEYVSSFATLNDDAKRQMLDEQKMTSDGITSESLLTIYRALYHRFDVLGETPWVSLQPSRSVTRITTLGQGYRLTMRHHLDYGKQQLECDVVIFATGYQAVQPAFLNPLAECLQTDENGAYRVDTDFTLDWQGPEDNCLFAVNAGVHSLGIAEPQLSLMPWRSARILNRACPHHQFELSLSPGVIQWRSPMAAVAQPVRKASMITGL